MDAGMIQWAATLGVGGVLAAGMFMFYRKDVAQLTDLWKTQTEMLVAVVIENTRSNVELTMTVRSLHKRLDRDEHYRSEARQEPDRLKTAKE